MTHRHNFGSDRGGHDDGLTMQRGTNVAATSWLFAEGTTVNRFETYLTILTPTDRRVRVTARFYGAGSELLGSRIVMAPLSRANIKLNSFLNASGIAGVVTSDSSVVVELPKYFRLAERCRNPGERRVRADRSGGALEFSGGIRGG